jgi:predicted ester cyclase
MSPIRVTFTVEEVGTGGGAVQTGTQGGVVQTGTQSSEQLKELGRRYVEEVLNRHDPSALDGFLATDFVDHNPTPGPAAAAPGLEGAKSQHEELFAAFPDIRTTVDLALAEGDLLTMKLTQSGTMEGAFQGLSPTNAPFENKQIHVMRVRDGKFVEHWAELDALTTLQQLGFVGPGLADLPHPVELDLAGAAGIGGTPANGGARTGAASASGGPPRQRRPGQR